MNAMVSLDSMEAYVARPAVPNGFGVVLGMSVWGLVPDLRGWADLLAALGYAVIAPNLYWRSAPRHALPYDMQRLGELRSVMDSVTDNEALADLDRAAVWLRVEAAIERIAIVGWCFGGRLACIAAERSGWSAAVAFYPTALETRLDVLDRLRAPLQIHLAEHERYATREDSIALIVAAAAMPERADAIVYPAAQHGFMFRPPHPAYDGNAARLATVRSALFLRSHL
jgi:carboxymethylenebutenolidase